MNAIDLLKQDHRTVHDRYAQYRETGEQSSKQKTEIAGEICGLLETHAKLEEQAFYPKLKSAAPDLISKAEQEHGQVEQMIQDLKELQGNEDKAEEFHAMFNDMMDAVERHVQEEEEKLFPVAQRELGNQIDELGDEIQQRKQEITKAT